MKLSQHRTSTFVGLLFISSCVFSGFALPVLAVTETRVQVDCSTLTGKVMCGYQGWFNCEGDGADLGWVHWCRGRKGTFGPGNVTVDLWPDMTDATAAERFATGFRHADGRTAEVFSSANRTTVIRHFTWMREYGIDGAFVQRFATSIRRPKSLRNRNMILDHCRAGAEQNGRAFAVMYDLSGMRINSLDAIADDWQRLVTERKVDSSSAYLHHEGKPLVAVWGIGFNDRHQGQSYSLEDCRRLIVRLKQAGCGVMLGVPTGWRNKDRDCVDDARVHEILALADVISPWTPGRYRNPKEVSRHAAKYWAPDIQRCEELEQDYLPVVFPGFSWKNLKQGDAKLGAIPRLKGKFLWAQVTLAKQSGAKMLYVAMFDEVDEGTAIFKCTNDPPVGDGVSFLGYEGLPSDFYLRLVGRAGKVIRGDIAPNADLSSQD